MLKENDRLVGGLSRLFLNEKDPDRAYFKVVGIIKRLNNRRIEVSIGEVQRRAYKCEEEK
ncbi:MAG: hypothetical protein ACTSSP_03325 [Candidatus Asgardarchaeia archaeon]